jgi:hypothetical protein
MMRPPTPLAAALGLLLLASPLNAGGGDWPIIRRHGDGLYEGERPFRFFGLDAPNLHQNESQVRRDFSNRFPDEYEIRDVLGSLHRLGARATRTFVLSVASRDDGGLPTYITGRGRSNEAAFRTLDRVLALCRDYDVRVIIPIVASQSFVGWRGVDEFAALSGKPPGSFWTDPEVKSDFRALLYRLVNRRNTLTGALYRDDPAILAWQLGNEFDSYAPDRRLDPQTWRPRITAWSLETAAYLHSVDPRHLVMEAGGDRARLLASPAIDVMSVHLYEYWNRVSGLPSDLAPLARQAAEECRGHKPLIIDEFGLASVGNVRALMRTIREEGVSGGLLWSLRGHRRDGGFYCHNEGGTAVNSYHFPGFAAGQGYDETELLGLVRTEAFAIRGVDPGVAEPPGPPPVLAFERGGFTWRGSTGAARYAMERAEAEAGPWSFCAGELADSTLVEVAAYEASGDSRPPLLWMDNAAPRGSEHYYRVRGLNPAGATAYSNVVRARIP